MTYSKTDTAFKRLRSACPASSPGLLVLFHVWDSIDELRWQYLLTSKGGNCPSDTQPRAAEQFHGLSYMGSPFLICYGPGAQLSWWQADRAQGLGLPGLPGRKAYGAGLSDLQLVGRVGPRMAMNAAPHKTVHLPKPSWDFFGFVSVCAFNVWPKTTLLLPVWPRDTKSLDTPSTVLGPHSSHHKHDWHLFGCHWGWEGWQPRKCPRWDWGEEKILFFFFFFFVFSQWCRYRTGTQRGEWLAHCHIEINGLASIRDQVPVPKPKAFLLFMVVHALPCSFGESVLSDSYPSPSFFLTSRSSQHLHNQLAVLSFLFEILSLVSVFITKLRLMSESLAFQLW